MGTNNRRIMLLSTWVVITTACGGNTIHTAKPTTPNVIVSGESPETPTLDRSTAPLGTNVGGVHFWSVAMFGYNAFHQASQWFAHGKDGYWDTEIPLTFDSLGYPIFLPEGVEAAGVLLFGGVCGDYPSGDYTLRWDGYGEPEVRFAGSITDLDLVNRKAVVAVDATGASCDTGINIKFRNIDPNNHVHNIRFLYPTYSEENPGPTFLQAFIDEMKQFGVLRFMDWNATNNQTLMSWENRTRPDHYSQTTASGVAIEYMIDLANEVRADAWFTIPHLVDDQYVTEFAKLVKTRLHADLDIYVEYSNEVWNWLFSQAAYADSEGKRLGLPEPTNQTFYAKRSCDVFRLWQAQFSESERSRLKFVLASQSANPWISEQIVKYENAYQCADALAIAPYFGGVLGAPENVDETSKLTVDQLFDLLEQTHLPIAYDAMEAQKAIADAYGLQLIAYEGGQHLVGYGGAENNELLTNLFIEANRHTRMQTIYDQYLDTWKAIGGDAFLHYMSTSTRYHKFGSWGIRESLVDDQAPKYQAVRRFNQKHNKWW